MRSPTTSCKLTACSEVTASPLRRSQGCRGEPAAAITGCSCVDHTKRLASPAGLPRMEHADRIRKLILTAGKKLKKVTPSQGDGDSESFSAAVGLLHRDVRGLDDGSPFRRFSSHERL